MDDATGVRRGEAACHLKRDVDRFVDREPPDGKTRTQRLAVEAFRNQVGGAAVLADVVNRDDIGVIEGARRAGLLVEAPHAICISREIRKQHFDGDVSAQALVARTPHLAHPARPQPLVNDVCTKPIASPQAPPIAGDSARQDIERRRAKKVARLL